MNEKLPNSITCLVRVPDNDNFKTPELLEVEKTLNTFQQRVSIDWSVMDDGDRQSFEVRSYVLCDEITGIRDFTLVHDKDPFKYIEPEGKNWYIAFKNNYIAGDNPAVCIQAMLNFMIAEKQKEIELLVAKKHLPEKDEPTLE